MCQCWHLHIMHQKWATWHMHLSWASWRHLSKSVHTTSTCATAAIQNSAHCMCLAILSDTYGHTGTTTNVWIKHAADMQSLNVYHTRYCSSMLTSSNLASLGEPLQTLSEVRYFHKKMNDVGWSSGGQHPTVNGQSAVSQQWVSGRSMVGHPVE